MLISLADENFVADTLPSGLDDTLRACAIERLANTDAMVALGVMMIKLDDRLKLIPIGNIPHVSPLNGVQVLSVRVQTHHF